MVGPRDLCWASGVMGVSTSSQGEAQRGPRATVSSSVGGASDSTFYKPPRHLPCSPVDQATQWLSCYSNGRTLPLNRHPHPWELVRKVNYGPHPAEWKLRAREGGVLQSIFQVFQSL